MSKNRRKISQIRIPFQFKKQVACREENIRSPRELNEEFVHFSVDSSCPKYYLTHKYLLLIFIFFHFNLKIFQNTIIIAQPLFFHCGKRK